MNDGCINFDNATYGCQAAAACGVEGEQLPLSLKLTAWGCEDDCKYHCMRSIEAKKQLDGSGPIVQYYGKWPFMRVLGIQELCSVIFSILNLLAHLHNLQLYYQHTRPLQKGLSALKVTLVYPYYRLWPMYSMFAINAWLFSTVFHTRDTRVTDKLDYFSADAFIFIGLATAIIRTFHVTSSAKQTLLFMGTAFFALRHFHHMLYVKFDYGYNMKLCIACGVLQAVLWVAYCVRVKHPARHWLFKYTGALNIAMLLEILDFPPLFGLLDAHACWHAATAPIVYLWYRFLREDVTWTVQQNGGYMSMYKEKQ